MAQAGGTNIWRRIVSKFGFGYSFFISYAAEQGRYAGALKAELEKRRLITFLDTTDIYTSDERQTTGKRLVAAIGGSGVLLLIDTPRAREKFWPAHEVEAAVLVGTTIVRIEAPDTPTSWPYLSPLALERVNGSTRYAESATNIDAGTPSTQLLDGLAAHLNWRRYWPIVHRSLLLVGCVAGAIGLLDQKVASVVAQVSVNPITAQAASDARPLFGSLNGLFAFVSPSGMATIRRRLLDMHARQLELVARADDDHTASPCGDDQDNAGPLTADDLAGLKAFVERKNTNQWHVDPTGRYLVAVGGVGAITRVWRIEAIRRNDADAMAAQWSNEGRETCTTSFDPTGTVLLLGQRFGAQAELRLRALPSGLPLGEPLSLPGRFPIAITYKAREPSVVTDAARTRWLASPHPPKVVTRVRGLVYSGGMGPDGLLALSYDALHVVDVCRTTAGELQCTAVWSDLPQGVEPRPIAVDSLRSIGNGETELRVRTRAQLVTCRGRELSAWSCHAVCAVHPEATTEVVRESAGWKLIAAAGHNQFDKFRASICRQRVWPGPYRELDRAGRLLDASFREDVLEILWAWPPEHVVVEEIALTEDAVQQRIQEGVEPSGR